MRRLGLLLVLLVTAFGLAGAPARAQSLPSTCHGDFINPISDVCWSCLFPLSIGGLSIWKGNRPDPKNPSFPLCACGSPIPRIGISVGFWEPVRLVDVTNKPWCFPNLGGIKLDPGFDIGQGHVQGRSQVGGKTQNSSQWQSHYYIYPLLYWMEILVDFLCFVRCGLCHGDRSVVAGFVADLDHQSRGCTLCEPDRGCGLRGRLCREHT